MGKNGDSLHGKDGGSLIKNDSQYLGGFDETSLYALFIGVSVMALFESVCLEPADF